MRLVRQTTTRLTIQYWPVRAWLLSGALFGTFALLGAVLSGAFAAGMVSQLNCQRTQATAGSCTLTEIQQPLYAEKIEQTRTIPLAQISGARVKQQKEAEQTVYTLALMTSEGEIVLQSVQGTDTAAIAAVEQIRQFLQTPSASTLAITYRYNTLKAGEALYLLFRFGLFAIPGLSLLLSPGLFLTLDQRTQQLQVFRWGGLSGWGRTTYSLAALCQVQAPPSTRSPVDEHKQITTLAPNQEPIRLRFNSGEEIWLPPGKTNLDDQRLVNQLRAFLPPQESAS